MTQKIITEEKIIDELKKAIVNALGVDEASIRPESILTMDLGAESLDFLDINFNLEQVFGFKMARHFVLDHAEEMFGEGSAIDEEGRLTDRAVKLLKMRFREDLPDLTAGIYVDEVVNLISMQSMAAAVMEILHTLPEKCPSCSDSAWKSDDDGTHIICGSCGENAVYINGDDLVVDWLKKVQEKERIF